MNDFNIIERKIALFLKKTPKLKYRLKYIYQSLVYLLYKKPYVYLSDLKIEAIDNAGEENFFGYYDKSPENVKGTLVLYHRTERATTKLPNSDDGVVIVCKDTRNGTERFTARTRTYNWQQGARLFWLDDSKFIFNDFEEEAYVARLVDLTNDNIQTFPLPVYDGFKMDYYLSCSFERLNQLRPDYGYRNHRVPVNFDNFDKEGVFKYSFANSRSKLIISIQELVELFPLTSMKDAMHKVNHIMISPDGNNFIFMHRWHKKSGLKYDRLLVSDSEGKSIRILADEGIVSHCCWKSESKIVGYFKYNGQLGWYETDIHTRDTKLISDKLSYLGDGHPTFRKGKLLIDSYPNRARMKKLYIYDYDKDILLVCGEFYESLKYYGQTRCDLHPRFDFNGDKIYIDSVHTGQRRLYRLSF